MTELSLTLSDAERDLVHEILEERHRGLLREIAHTDHHDFKVALREKAALLESILSRVMVDA